jgi:hypothetical protein
MLYALSSGKLWKIVKSNTIKIAISFQHHFSWQYFEQPYEIIGQTLIRIVTSPKFIKHGIIKGIKKLKFFW